MIDTYCHLDTYTRYSGPSIFELNFFFLFWQTESKPLILYEICMLNIELKFGQHIWLVVSTLSLCEIFESKIGDPL